MLGPFMVTLSGSKPIATRCPRNITNWKPFSSQTFLHLGFSLKLFRHSCLLLAGIFFQDLFPKFLFGILLRLIPNRAPSLPTDCMGGKKKHAGMTTRGFTVHIPINTPLHFFPILGKISGPVAKKTTVPSWMNQDKVLSFGTRQAVRPQPPRPEPRKK